MRSERENSISFQNLAVISLIVVGITGWAGCRSLAQPLDANDYQLGMARAAAATIFSITAEEELPGPQPTPPSPEPEPGPSTQCSRCNGTGRIKPDGRIEIACPDCDGDGKLEIANFVKLIAGLQSELIELRKGGASNQSPSKLKDHQCDCGPYCQCMGECNCRWPGECLGVLQRSSQSPELAEINWLADASEARKKSKETGRPVLLHWYTEICGPCKTMDANVFADPSVKAYVNAHFIPCRIDGNLVSTSTRISWGCTSFPLSQVVAPNWSARRNLSYTQNPNTYLNLLQGARVWSTTVTEEASRRRSVLPLRSTSSYQPSVTSLQSSDVSYQPSVVSSQPSTIYYEMPVVSRQYVEQPYYYPGSSQWFYQPTNCVNGVCW